MQGKESHVDRRHAPTARFGSSTRRSSAAGTTTLLYRGVKSREYVRDMYATDHAEPQREGRFRWLMSTCLAAAVGATAIFVVIFGSADQQDATSGLMPALQRLRESTTAPPLEALLRRDDGLKWSVPKVDRLRVTSGALSTRFVIHETLRQKRGGREYIYAKPYVRIVSRLAPVPPNYADVIPPFNPVKLYANNKPIGEEESTQSGAKSDVTVKVVELLGGILPGEDGQELDNEEAQELVTKVASAAAPKPDPTTEIAETDPAINSDQLGPAASAESQPETRAPNTTILAKSGGDEPDSSSDIAGLNTIVKTVQDGQKLSQVLADAGAETWLIREMLDAMKSVFPEKSVAPGSEVHITLQPSLTRQNRMEPIRFSVYDEGHAHKVTVSRSNAGEFVASADPVGEEELIRLASADTSQGSTLYASLYHASLVQSVPPETITQILRIHAYETDFRRRLRSDEQSEMFFDLKDEGGTEGPPGELLYTSITAGGEQSRYYRFRTTDGQIDYYDAEGNNAKKFLMRRPVRGEDIRLTSGFGLRFHPLLNEKRMHTGVDWATTPGTPILAAGNGTIEEAGRKGQYGIYVRIRHANGYQTAYGHMSGLARGAAAGVKVRQGQVIGYIGSTGLSSGPHLHFEVLVNNQFVDPMSIQVPRERHLEGHELADFQKERARIDELMRRSPVLTATK